MKLRIMRPLPKEELKKFLRKMKMVYVLDRSTTMSTIGGPIYVELRSLLYEEKEKPKMVNYIYGLGGREVSVKDIMSIVGKPCKTQINYLGVRE
jgi:pyruvate ferredoxin oxidoreductase alpha subunit